VSESERYKKKKFPIIDTNKSTARTADKIFNPSPLLIEYLRIIFIYYTISKDETIYKSLDEIILKPFHILKESNPNF